MIEGYLPDWRQWLSQDLHPRPRTGSEISCDSPVVVAVSPFSLPVDRQLYLTCCDVMVDKSQQACIVCIRAALHFVKGPYAEAREDLSCLCQCSMMSCYQVAFLTSL